MHHFFDAITDNKGNALTGYYVRVTDSSGVGQTLYADASLTPIISVSGIADAAQVDGNGNVDFYVNVGTYTVNIYATDGATLVHSVVDVPMLVDTSGLYGAVGELVQVGSRSALSAITPTANLVRYLTESGREGTFVFDAADHSAHVAADSQQGIFVAPSSDPTGASGAWVRKYVGFWKPEWFGAVGDGTTNDQTAFSGINSLAAVVGYLHLELQPNTYMVNRQSLNTNGFYQDAVNGISAIGLSSVIIRGNGATLKTNPGLKFGAFDPATGNPVTYGSPAAPDTAKANIGDMVHATACGTVSISDLFVDGNSASHVIGGKIDTTGTGTHHNGVLLGANLSVDCRNVHVVNCLEDNWEVGFGGIDDTTDPRPHTFHNCSGDSAGRNNLSFVGGNQATFTTCSFTRGGCAPVAGGGVMTSSPAAGLDIEAESAVIRRVRFRDCIFTSGPHGFNPITSGSGDSENIIFDGCTFVGGVTAGSPRMRFTRCKFYGRFAKLYGDPDPMRATLIDDCFITDATLWDTPLVANPGGALVAGTTPTGAQIKNSTIDVSRLQVGIAGMLTDNVLIMFRAGTDAIASGGNAILLTNGTHRRLNIIDALTANFPATPFIVVTTGATIYDSNLTSATPNMKWVGSGASGFTGRYDSSTRTGIGGVGYGTGSGGTVTQVTSKSTGVTLSKASGQITMKNSALSAGAVVSFLLTNTLIAADDELVVRIKSGNATTGTYSVWAEGNADGSRTINVQNISAGSLSEALVLGFILLKGSSV